MRDNMVESNDNFPNNSESDDELMAMFSNNENNLGDDNALENSDNKVLVKSDGVSRVSSDSDENGYGSVPGVILIIISISFILAALLIRMMI